MSLRGDGQLKTILVDGHNLIPKIPGLHLEDLDDENKLLEILLDYCRYAQARIELFFDGAPPGYKKRTNHGMVHIHPVRKGSTADDAIIAFLRSSGSNARNMKVVSSDNRVRVEAKALHASVISSEVFSREIQNTLSSPRAIQEQREKIPSIEEVEEWEKLFTAKRQEKSLD